MNLSNLQRYHLILVWILGLTIPSLSQGLRPDVPMHKYTLNQWTVHDGLSSNNATQIMQSDDGYLWITSFSGIHKFDGNEFKLFTVRDIPFIESNAFYSMYQDDQGIIWFPSQASGLIVYDHGYFRKVIDSPKAIRSVFKDSNGTVWVGSNNFGAFTIKDSTAIPVEINELRSGSIYDIKEDPKGNIWFATESFGLVSLKSDGSKKVYSIKEGLTSNFILKLQIDSDKIIFGTTNGIGMVKDDSVQMIDKLAGFQVNDFFIDTTNKLWYLATETGLVRYIPGTNEMEVYEVSEGLPVNQIKSLCKDHEGSLWMSTSKGGILRLKNGNFTNYDTENGLSNNLVNIIYEHDNKFYVGTDVGKINVITGDNIEKFPVKFDFEGLGIRDFFIDEDNTLWIASYHGILKIDQDGKEEIVTEADGLPANDIRRIFQDSNGRIWIGTRSGGVAVIDDDAIRIIDRENGMESNYILSIEENPAGEILIGTNGGGLTIIDQNDSVRTDHLSNDDSGLLIFNIHARDQTFLITSVGIFIKLKDGFKKLNFGISLVTRTFFDLTEDKLGNYWITSNDGLVQLRKSDLISAIDQGRNLHTNTFDDSDGMGNSECTGATRMLTSSTGSIWVPTIGGAAVLNPDELNRAAIDPNVFIVGFSTEEFSLTGNLNGTMGFQVLPGNHRYVIEFTALSYLSPDNVRFRYMLEGFDSDWIENEEDREAVYTNLSPGEYTFKVMATPDLDGWDFDPVALNFEVQPMFHQTIWFYLLLILVLGGAVFLVDYYRVNNVMRRNQELRKLNDELDRFVYSTSHDLRAPLASILGLTDLAKKETSDDEKNEYLDLIRASAIKLDRFIHEILDYSRNARFGVIKEPIDFKAIVNETFTELEYQEKDLVIHKELDIDTGNFVSDRGRIKVIFNNLISNSIRYRNPDNGDLRIWISVKLNKKGATINLKDNGKGIKKDLLPKVFEMFWRGSEDSSGSGLGLYIVKECILKLGGEISVKSQEGKWTEFQMEVPQMT